MTPTCHTPNSRWFLPAAAFAAAATLAVLPLTTTHADAPTVRLSEPVESTPDSETFGAPLDASGPVLSLAELMADSDRYLNENVLVQTKIAKVCQKKGCFFIASDGATTVRVSFKDYGFFVPTDSGGKSVTLAGVLVRKDLSPGKAEHLAEDLKAPGTIKAGPAYELVATSVRIPRG